MLVVDCLLVAKCWAWSVCEQSLSLKVHQDVLFESFRQIMTNMTNQKKKNGIPVSPSYLPSYPTTMLPCRVSGRSRSFVALLLRLRAKQADTALAFDTLPERCGSAVSSTLTGWTIFVSNVSKTVGGKKLQISKVKITSKRCEDTQRCLGVLWRSFSFE